jgi:DUF218 domain
MSANTQILRPEQEFRRINHKLLRDHGQSTAVGTGICILGTYFDLDKGPSARMLSRMLHAEGLVWSGPPTRLVASGGLHGTGGTIVTEAQMIDRWFRQRQFTRLYRDDFAAETVGNIVFSTLGILRPIGVEHIVFVTDVCHAPRVEKYALHILKGLMKVSISAAPWPLSAEAEAKEQQTEKAGLHFVDRFLDEVPPGNPEYAFEWISANHKAHPYLGWNLEEIVAVLRGQLFDFDTVAHGYTLPRQI